MNLGIVWLKIQGLFVVFQGFFDPSAVFAKDSKIVKHRRIGCSCRDHLFVNRFGFS